jgi:ribosome-associated protein
MTEAHSNESRLVSVSRTPIELCQFLKFAGLVGSGGQAKQAIAAGHVLLNDAVEMRKRRKLVLGDRVTFSGQTITVGS